MPYRIALPPDIAQKVGAEAIDNIPDDVKPEDVKARVLAKIGPPPPKGSRESIEQGAREFFATGAGKEFAKGPSALETAVASVPLIAGGGVAAEALGVPVMLGKAAAGGTIGAGQALASGQPIGLTAALDAVLAAGGELVGGKFLGGIGGKAARGFEMGAKKMRAALAAVADRLPPGRFNLPSLSNVRLTAEEAIEKLLEKRGQAFQVALAEVKNVFNAVDRQLLSGGPKPGAGTVLERLARTKARTPAYRVEPSAFSRFAQELGPTAGTALGAQAVAPVRGVPLGAMEGAAGMEMTGATLGSLARHLAPYLVP